LNHLTCGSTKIISASAMEDCKSKYKAPYLNLHFF
jgi:hypothetical protein